MTLRDLPPEANLIGQRVRHPKTGDIICIRDWWGGGIWWSRSESDDTRFPMNLDDLMELEVVQQERTEA